MRNAMADTKLLYTLSRCVEAGYAEAVNLAVTRFDPLQRRGLKRAVHEAMASVANATHLSPEGAGETHHLRLALLASAGQLQSVNGDDAEGVAAAARTIVAAHPARRGRAFWPITYAIASLLLVSGLAALAVILWPTPEERFRTSAFGEALGEPLTQFVVKAGRGKGAANEPRAELLSFGVRRQLGDEATHLLEEVLTLTVDASEAQTDADTKAAITQLDQSARKLNQQLEARRIPALVDPYAFESGNQGGAAVYLLGYFVEDRALVDYAKEAPRRVFWARRLDRLNLKAGLYVYPSKSADAVILSLDDLQQSILSSDVDTLGKGRPFKLGGAASDSPAAMKLGQLVRDELLFASKLSDVEADDIASLMAKRRKTNILKNLCSGPGKLVQALGIARIPNGTPLLSVERRYPFAPVCSVLTRFMLMPVSVASIADGYWV